MGCPMSSLVQVTPPEGTGACLSPSTLVPMLRSCSSLFAWLEMHPSCEGRNEIQVPWIASNCSHCLKVPRGEGNILLNAQK